MAMWYLSVYTPVHHTNCSIMVIIGEVMVFSTDACMAMRADHMCLHHRSVLILVVHVLLYTHLCSLTKAMCVIGQ